MRKKAKEFFYQLTRKDPAAFRAKITAIKKVFIALDRESNSESQERLTSQPTKFLDTASKMDLIKRDAHFLLQVAIAEKRLNLGQHHDCLKIISDVRAETEQLSDIDPKVYAMEAEVFAAYYRRKEDFENYYKSGLQFLAYTPASELTVDEHK